MSDKPYVKECNFCKNKITMSKESGNWLPYELNSDKKHDCRKENHKEITLEAVQKKLESIGIIINVEANGAVTKWICFICGQVVPKFSLVVSHVEKHKEKQSKGSEK